MSDLPARSPHLSHQVADWLREEIISGALAPGERLPTEAALCERFEISRSVVREAISVLRDAGLVVSRRGSGSYVAEVASAMISLPLPGDQLSAVTGVLELRRALESEAAELAALRRTPAQLRRLKMALEELDEAVAAGGDGVEEDVAFHRLVAEASNSPYLLKVVNLCHVLLRRTIRITRSNEAKRGVYMRQVEREHALIVERIEAQDAQGASAAIRSHLEHAELRLRAC
ncbi:FadR/GntR family transcriptional regulator [Halotalea alkalilenta]|uniref:HTH gntR-type domain-containing protein n=1 Tax=Halotalea alkalilenta TaxID=376489 RepID=A0A172YIM1_9GAMM|nr:FadR/GntR family transcriptional regulator [Halotalea alkalilenta]ANF59026.1 hypothetical protein A5892_17450 [Halotalea alkalilenta]